MLTVPKLTTSAAPAVELSQDAVSFGRKEQAVVALQETNLRIADGEFVALVGPSGCGKSTIMRLTAGLLQPTRTAPARVKRGAFGPTYGQDPDQEQDLGQEGQQPARSSGSAGPSQPKRTSKKRKSEQPVSQPKRTKSKEARDQGNTNSSCEACGGHYHSLSDCYYLFPSKAPSWFEENPVIRDGVKYRLSNQGLKDKVKALKGSPRLAESD